jgi:hypothetical protein
VRHSGHEILIRFSGMIAFLSRMDPDVMHTPHLSGNHFETSVNNLSPEYPFPIT